MAGGDAGEGARNCTAENETHETTERARTLRRPVRSHGRRTFLSAIGIAGLGAVGASGRRLSAVSDDGVVRSVDDDDPTAIDSCVVIDEPGTYELVDDIVLEGSVTACIDVQASDVVLRGNGHVIDGSGGSDAIAGVRMWPGRDFVPDPEPGIDPRRPEPITNVTVADLEVAGFGRGLYTYFASGVTLSGITARNNDAAGLALFGGTSGAEVTDSAFYDNAHGIFVAGDPHHPEAPAGVGSNTYEHNDVRRNGVAGVRLDEGVQGQEFRMNRILDNANGVLHTEFGPNGNVYHENVICRNERYGVRSVEGLVEPGVVNATNNFWGAANGPSSFGDPAEPFTDPETGRPADGDGDAVSRGAEPGVASVRFDPFREETIEEAGQRD